MIMHMTIHHPDPEKTDLIVDAMHRFDQRMRGQPGLLSIHTLRDAQTGTLISLAVWDTKDTWLSALPAVHRAESEEDLSGWESQPPVVYHLEEL